MRVYKGVCEFNFASVESCVSGKVMHRSVKASPIRYEYTLREVIPIRNLPTGGIVILVCVKCIYIRDNSYKNGNISQ